MARKSKPTKPKKQDALELAVSSFNRSWEYAKNNYHTKWEDAFALYNNKRVKVGYQGITNTFVPMTFSTVEIMVSAMFGAKPKFEFEPPQEQAGQETEILNALLDYYWDKDKWNIKVIKWGRGMIREGTSVVYLYWDIDHPCMVNLPLRDFIIDPDATDIDNARYVGRRYLIGLDKLKELEVVDPETGEMTPRYKNLDNIATGNTSENETDKQKKDMFYGSNVEDKDGNTVEVIELWFDDDRVISVVNRATVIEDTENWFKTKDRDNRMAKGDDNAELYAAGVRPFAAFRNYTDESLFYGKGEVEVIADQQELLNDLTNQNQDSIIYSLNQMYTLDPKYAHMIEQIENLPGAVYPVEAGALQPIERAMIPSDAFNERINLKNEIRETTASNEIVKGVGQEQQTTATEVNAQIAGSGQRLSLKITQIENEGFHSLAKIVFEMIKRYVTEPMMVKIVGKDGVRWEEYDPEAFQGDYEPRVQLDTSIQAKKAEDAAMAKEMLAAFLNDPEINQPELKKMVLMKSFDLDPDEVDRLVQPDPMMGMEGMGGMEGEDPMAAMGGEMGGEMPMEMPMDPMQDPMMTEPMPAEMGQEPSMDVVVDPVTGELIPAGEEPLPPTDEEILAMIDAGLV